MSIFNLIVGVEFLTARFCKQKGFLIFENNAYNAQYNIGVWDHTYYKNCFNTLYMILFGCTIVRKYMNVYLFNSIK